MQMSAAIFMALRAISSASRAVDVDQRARRGERIGPAGADADQPVLGLQHIAGAGQDQAHLPGRPPPSSPPAGADSGRCASPWPARRRRGRAGPDAARAWPPAARTGRRHRRSRRRSRRSPSPLPSRRTLRAFDLMTVLPKRDLAVAGDHDLALPCGPRGSSCRARRRPWAWSEDRSCGCSDRH